MFSQVRSPAGTVPLLRTGTIAAMVGSRKGTVPFSQPGRRAFTLVELLVVITIIIILMGLLTPVIMIALGNAKEARIIGDIAGLDTALKAYKEKYGSYPPSDFSDMMIGVNVNTNSSAARHLAKAFPRCDVTVELKYIQQPWEPANLTFPAGQFFSPADALVFWLSGFSPDPEHPITGLLPPPGTSVANALAMSLPTRSPFFEFAQARVQRQPRWSNLGSGTVVQLQNGVWAYCDGSSNWYLTVPVYSPADTPGVPYVYFASQNYVVRTGGVPFINTAGYQVAFPYDTRTWQQGGQPSSVCPYASDPPAGQFPAGGNWKSGQGPQPVNPNSFQIISAGLDGDFGGGGVGVQGSGHPILAYFPSGMFYASGDNDNLTNFSPRNLGDSIPK
jgi:type II secretory pathway pseudopilin PulG